MDQQGLQKQLHEGKIASVYLFFGEERLLINQAIATIKQQSLTEDLADFNYEVVAGEKLGAKQVVDLANTLPFMASCRIVVIDQPAMLAATAKGEGGKGDDEVFLAYLDDPNPQCCLILKGGLKVDKRKKLFKKLQDQAVTVEFMPLRGTQLEKWIRQYVAQSQKKIAQPALEYLCAMGQYTLEILTNELDKAVLYCGEADTLTLSMVQSIVTKTVDANIFDLIDAIGNQKGQVAIRLLQDTLYLGEAPLKILALLVRHFRLLIIMKDLQAQGHTEQQIKEKMKLHPFVVRKGLKQGTRFKMDQLIDFLEKLLLTEVELKSSTVSGGQLLERLVIDLCYLK